MRGDIVPQWEDDDVLLPKVPEIKPNAISDASDTVRQHEQIIRFQGKAMLLENEPFPHYVVLTFDKFKEIAYPLLGAKGISKMRDIYDYVGYAAEDLTPNDRYLLLGYKHINDETGEAEGFPTVWDMKTLSTVQHIPPMNCIWRSPISRVVDMIIPPRPPEPIPFVMSLAGGEQDLYDDIMQSIAPIIMEKKPDGVIWWVGDGANGKSTLMDALYRLFPDQLASINVKRLTDGRDTPSLNGKLANVVKESSEGRVEDTDIYKSIGTHENFRVHKFHSQDDVQINGNMHHIFSANNIPAFNDKGYSALRRTFIIPFKQRFESDPNFERNTFTDDMLGRLLSEICRYASRIAAQGYKYKWSAVTRDAKTDYDADASNGLEYARQMIAEGLIGFEGYNNLQMDYERWCAELGYTPLRIRNLGKAMRSSGFEEDTSHKDSNGKTLRWYHLPDMKREERLPFGIGRPGLYTTQGFAPEPTPPPQTSLPVEEPKEPPKKDIIGNKW